MQLSLTELIITSHTFELIEHQAGLSCLYTHLSTLNVILDHPLRLRGSLTKIKSSNFDEISRIIDHE